MTIPQALYYYAAPPLLFALGYLLGRLLGRLHKPKPDTWRLRDVDRLPGGGSGWYPPTPRYDEETARRCEMARTGRGEAPTTKREIPGEQGTGEGS